MSNLRKFINSETLIKDEIYKNYTHYEILLTETSSFSFKNSFYKANKLLLNFMNNEIDKKFIWVKYDILSKEILNYNKLNTLEGKLSIFFKIFIDLLDISIKRTQNDKIFSLYAIEPSPTKVIEYSEFLNSANKSEIFSQEKSRLKI